MLDKIGEFGLIQRIQEWGGKTDKRLLLGIGDDAAAIRTDPHSALLLTTDLLMEKVHFSLPVLLSGQNQNRSSKKRCDAFFKAGYKAVSVNVSDIAAMGGSPLFYMVSLGLSGKESVEEIDHLYRGIDSAGQETKIRLIGGNTARSRTGFFISITLIGEVPPDEMVRRSGGSVGDILYVTGMLGDAAAGVLPTGKKRSLPASLVLKQELPKARWKEGRLLAKKQIPSAMIDLSDGLSSDLGHLANQSGVGAELWADRIPISPALKRWAKKKGADPLSYALHGGEDYELLFSVPEKKQARLERMIRFGQIQARPIGILIEKEAGLLIKTGENVRPLVSGGYDHFKKDNKKVRS
jgi:thiamine-monophosphate kinase